MDTQGEHSVIHRKAQVARDEFDAREMSPAKALRLSLAKSADRLFDLALTVSTVEQIRLAQTGIEAEFGEPGLLVLLDGKEGARGALKLDLQFLTALIEVQLMGKVRPGEVARRPVTRTDAAIAAPLVDALLAGFDENQQEAMAGHVAGGFRFGDLIEDGRTLSLALNQPEYDLFRLTADLGPGAKTGTLSLVLPLQPLPKQKNDAETTSGLKAKLEQNAMNAPVTLDAVMGRMSLPLNRICAWQPGTIVPLSPDALAETELLGAKGHVVARVRLGQLNGFRAVRLILPESAGQDMGDEPRPPAGQIVDPPPVAPRTPPLDVHTEPTGEPVWDGALSGLPQLIGSPAGPGPAAPYPDLNEEA